MPWEMSWFPSPAAFAACSVFVWLLLVLFVYRLAVTVGKPQVGASAGAEPSPGRQGGGSAGAREQPQGRAGEALPGRGGRFPSGPWPAWARRLGAGRGLGLAGLWFFAGAAEAAGNVALSPTAFLACVEREAEEAPMQTQHGGCQR